MDQSFVETLRLTFEISLVTTAILFFLSIPLAYYLAYSRHRFKHLIETLVSLPLVLPPSVLGFYLLLVYSPAHLPGSFIQNELGIQLAFSYLGIVIGSVLFSLPFMVSPIQAAFESLPVSLKEASYSLGKSGTYTLIRVLLPNIKPALIKAIVLTFAHTIGEFGVVLMIGGNIPGKTRVASIAIYDEVQSLNFAVAHQYALILVSISFAILMVIHVLNRKTNKHMWS
jgi:molybdate transport system permease protein